MARPVNAGTPALAGVPFYGRGWTADAPKEPGRPDREGRVAEHS
jgi:GH18 family chitinase